MRTDDFTAAPAFADCRSAFFGGTRYSGLRALLHVAVLWRGVARRMRSSPGYLGHFVWYRFPFTLGTVSLWDSREHMLAFARTAEHRAAAAWLLRPGAAEGAFIRFLAAEPAGHTLGAWRVEHEEAR
jgi:heme-degrading monooxygenase HmoA